MRIVFRADASIQIGTGHVMRCLTLADALRERGFETLFICRELDGFSAKMVTDRGHDLRLLPAPEKTNQVLPNNPVHAPWLGVPWEQDAEQTSDILQSLGSVDWLVVDHYALDFRWEGRLRSRVQKIMVVDDLADRRHDCDLLVDQTLAASEERYRSLVHEECDLLLGPRYAMLRPEFAQNRDAALEKRKQTTSIRKILVAMGGTDPFNVTERSLQGIELLGNKELEVTVVLGSSAPHLKAITEKAQKSKLRISVLTDAQDMAEIMVDHDLCIGSGGMTSWERCVLGLPSLTITLADNQEPVLRELHRLGRTKHLGRLESIQPAVIRDEIAKITGDMSLFHDMTKAGGEICDGQGTKRIVSSLYAASLSLRPANSDDCWTYWEWANDPETRTASFSSAFIPHEDHQHWFHNRLNDPETFLFIAELSDNCPVGQIRFEKVSDYALVSISIDKKFRGARLGVAVLRKGIQQIVEKTNIRTITAEIKSTNRASKKIFQQAGFHDHQHKTKSSGEHFFLMNYTISQEF
ncbi:UDP-2,4-diacetamido-2,4,6-trideoxy-beta-L-altropyranose hydrolase [Desulfoplanes sp. PS50]